MLIILCSWIVITCIFLAFGGTLLSICDKVQKRNHIYSFPEVFFAGLFGVSSCAYALSLFLPLNIYVLLGFFLLTVLYWTVHFRKILSSYKEIRKTFLKLSKWGKFTVILLLLILILFSLSIPYNTPTLHDIGLYHLQSMMWAEQYSVVPGLGNLHGRLAFNSGYLLLSTLFSYHPSYFPTFITIGGLCLFVFSFWIVVKTEKLKSGISAISMYLLLFLFLYIFRHAIPTTSTDLLVNVLVMYILLNLALGKNASEKLFIMSLLSFLCFTLKLSSAPILLVALWSIIQFVKAKNLKPIYLLVLLGTLIAVPWVIRFVVLSGYLVYPLPSVDLFSFDWKMPETMVVAEKDAAYAWARVQNADAAVVLNMPFYEWIPKWASQQSSLCLVLYIFAFVSPMIVFVRKKFFVKHFSLFIVWLVAFIGTLFGFITAPDIRFSLGFVLCTIIIPLQMKSYLMNKVVSFLHSRTVIVRNGIIILGSLLLFMLGIRQLLHYKTDGPLYTFLIKPQPLEYVRKRDALQFERMQIGDIMLYYPKQGDQCFNQYLPCTPYPNENLEMRGKSLQDGFRMKKID